MKKLNQHKVAEMFILTDHVVIPHFSVWLGWGQGRDF